MPLHEAAERLFGHTVECLGGPEAAVPVLVPEDLRQHPDYERFVEKDGEGQHSALVDWIRRRLELEVAFEYGYSIRAGRSLEKTGCSTLAIDTDAISKVAEQVTMILANDGVLVSLAGGPDVAQVRLFLVGLLQRMRLRGGIFSPLLSLIHI